MSEARAPKGRGPVWLRRLANIGFAIAALYFVYLVSLLVVAYRNNQSFEGQPLGPTKIVAVPDSAAVDLEALSADAKTVVILWATWCGPCHSLLMDLKDEVSAGKLNSEKIIAVSMGEPQSDVRAYLERYPLPFRVGVDPEGQLARRLKVSGTPTVVFLGPSSVIVKVSTGGFGLSGKVAEFLNSQ